MVYTSADSSTEYGPSTPASRSSESAWEMTSVISRASSGNARAGLELQLRIPSMDAARYPSKIARSSTKASFFAASLTGSQSESCEPRSTSSMAVRHGERHPQPHSGRRRAGAPPRRLRVASRRAGARADRRGHRSAGLADVDNRRPAMCRLKVGWPNSISAQAASVIGARSRYRLFIKGFLSGCRSTVSRQARRAPP